MDFCLLLKIWAKTLIKNFSQSLSSKKYSQKPLDHAKRSAANALRTASE